MNVQRALQRLARMGAREAMWRMRASVRNTADELSARVIAPRWDRSDLAESLVRGGQVDAIRRMLRARRWDAAHRALAARLASRPERFVIASHRRRDIATLVREHAPSAPQAAATAGDRLLAGEFDLLGYSGLRFDPAADRVADGIDWAVDPVNGRRPDPRFWTRVPFLDQASGDHKIIWELNRHQHWLVLGRAYWLTDDARYRAACIDQLEAWLASNPPLVGINWASMLELALRSLSWIWTLHFFADPADADADAVPWLVDLLVGLDRQLNQVERNLSYYFSPNTHLLGEALALYVGGRALPELAASARRETLGRRILETELSRQVASDGGYCERSTHYHRYTLDFYLLALAVARLTADRAAAGTFEAGVVRLANAARLIADDRGRAPHVGDDDGGSLLPIAGRPCDDWRDTLAIAAALTGRSALHVGPPPEEALWMLSHPALLPALPATSSQPAAPMASGALPATGWYVSRGPSGDHVLIDGGPHGYRNGGHAHADALSMTITVRGVPLAIDPGTGCYTCDPATRDRFRSSALHNTLTIDDRSQSLPAGPFHWERTADAEVRRWRTNGGFDYFEGAHDGYAPLEHRRHAFILHGDLIVVADLVTGAGRHAAVAHWHVDPRWSVSVRPGLATLTTPDERVEIAMTGEVDTLSADPASGLGWHAPVYGRIDPATTIRARHEGESPFWMFTAIGMNPGNAIRRLQLLPVWAEAGVLRHSAAVRITRAASVDELLFADPAEPPGSAQDAHRSWRISTLETNARFLFCRYGPEEHRPLGVAMVDGSLVRADERRRLDLVLPREVSDLHVDLSPAGVPPQPAEARISGPVPGARLVVGGRELPLAAGQGTTEPPPASFGESGTLKI